MKNLLLGFMAVCLVTTVVFAQETITLKGDIIDNLCAGVNKEDLANFIKTHTKECALMPGCMDSGYAIFSDGTLYKFDPDSNSKIIEFLQKEDSNLQVVVTAKKVGEELSLVSLENQP